MTTRPPQEAPTALTELPSYLLTRIAHRYTQTIHAELKAVGLTTIATRIIVCLKIFRRLTVNELCVHALAEQPTMSRALDRCEADGIIRRRISDQDSRARVVELTDQGAALFEKIWPVMLAENVKMLDGIDAHDLEITLSTLRKILENIRVHEI